MDEKKLLSYPTKDLLEKFGQGSHKPGSGSAAAFQAMIATQLMHTVITITNEDKKNRREIYQHVLPELLEIDERIIKQIYPALEDLFQRDAYLFDKVIELRRLRDETADPKLKSRLSQECLDALVPATDILLDISDKCADLTDAAVVVFDKGFKAAKGDSGVAMNGALAALAGCLSIIDLNLSYFGHNTWTIKTRDALEKLRLDYNSLDKGVKLRMGTYATESREKSFERAKQELASGKWSGVRSSESKIEYVANEVHELLWQFRDLIWEKDTPKNRYEVMRADIVLWKILGYQFKYADLGSHDEGGSSFQIAGVINKGEKTVTISQALKAEVRNFTVAHELGHALLHEELTDLHRDRPIDKGGAGPRNIIEVEADKFASCFLMPARPLHEVFQEVFSIETFRITDNTMFIMGQKSMDDFKKRHPKLRDISRFVARYKRGTYRSLHEIFGVSAEAMAIRLETLGIVQS